MLCSRGLSPSTVTIRVKRIKGGQKKVLFLPGYGMEFDQPGVKWLMEGFRGRCDATFVTFSTEFSDHEGELIHPCRDLLSKDTYDELVGFSLGGLVVAYLNGFERRVFISPFWGINPRLVNIWTRTAVRGMARFRIKLVPRNFAISDAGHYAVEEDLKGMPIFLDARTIEEMAKAQEGLPPPEKGDAGIYCPDDMVMDPSLVEKRVKEAYRYNGGHMFHLVKDRERNMEVLYKYLEV